MKKEGSIRVVEREVWVKDVDFTVAELDLCVKDRSSIIESTYRVDNAGAMEVEDGFKDIVTSLFTITEPSAEAGEADMILT